MATEIKLRRDTYANWTSLNPVLAEGEIGLVTNFADNNTRIKIGDGSTAWNSLSYFTTSQDLSGYVTDAELVSALSSYVTSSSLTATLSNYPTDAELAVALSNYVPTSRTVNGKALSSNISIDKTDVGLGSVDNTSDANKPISTATQTALDLKQDKAIVVSSNTTAVNDAVYHNVATATYTDPSPVEGKGFTVLVINGTATVGGTDYSTAGTIIIRRYHSGSWANLVYTTGSAFDPTTAQIGDITATNTTIADNDTITTFASKTQGQLNNKAEKAETIIQNSFLSVDSQGRLINTGYFIDDVLIDVSRTITIDGVGNFTLADGTNASFDDVLIRDNDGVRRVALSSTANGYLQLGGGFTFGARATILTASTGLISNNIINNNSSLQVGNQANITANLRVGVAFSGTNPVITHSSSSVFSSLELMTIANTGTGGTGDVFINPGLPSSGAGGRAEFFANTRRAATTHGIRTIIVNQRNAAPTAAPTDCYIMWCDDIIAGNSAPHFMTENADIIKIYSIEGWGTPTGSLTRTTFDTTTVTLPQLAERVAALISDLKTGHQLLKA